MPCPCRLRRTILLTAMGTRGDVQPFVALGLHLRDARRWRVVLAVPPEYRGFVEGYGLEAEDIGISLQVGPLCALAAAVGASCPSRGGCQARGWAPHLAARLTPPCRLPLPAPRAAARRQLLAAGPCAAHCGRPHRVPG